MNKAVMGLDFFEEMNGTVQEYKTNYSAEYKQ